jgi:hypothetical protein
MLNERTCSMALTAAAAATQILTAATKTLNSARERAQASKDAELKALINTLYDEMASLREAVLRVTGESDELQRRLAQQAERPPEPEIRQVGEVNFYFVGEKGPYCQPCYDGKGKLVMLSPAHDWNGGVRRQCVLCKGNFYERPMDFGPGFAVIS